MKIAYGSDFHFEFYSEITAKRIIGSWKFDTDTDLIVIAGDLAVGSSLVLHLLDYIYYHHNIHVLYVPGNHEYYGSSFFEENIWFNKNNRRESYTILGEHSIYSDSNIVIVGAMGNIDGSYESINSWKHGALNDFHEIKDFSTDHEMMGKEEHRFIENELNFNDHKEKIVVTHTMPSPRCVAPEYSGSYLNACFCNDWADLIFKYTPKYWICGHTHTISKVNIYQTEVVMNPFGYPHENKEWKWEYITV